MYINTVVSLMSRSKQLTTCSLTTLGRKEVRRDREGQREGERGRGDRDVTF